MKVALLKPMFYWLILAPVLCVCPFHTATTGQDLRIPAPVPAPVAAVPVLETPIEADVLVDYERDQANKKLQTWPEYWKWVQTFYRGNLLSAGWTKFTQVTVDSIKADENRYAVLTKLNSLGKLISREWAKDASVRKITTTDLRGWHQTISAAGRDDDGSGRQLLDALGKIREKIESKRAG